MSKPETVPDKFTPPTYVAVFTFTGLLCILCGIAILLLLSGEGETQWSAVVLILAGFAEFIYAEIARDVARSAWQTARLAQDLAPALKELAAQAAERAARERAAEAEVRRVLAERSGVNQAGAL